MRTLLRLIIVWLIIAPISFYFGLPHLLVYLQSKTRAESYAQCLSQTAGQPGLFPVEQPAIGENYCHCVEQGVTVTRTDLYALARKQPATELNARVAAQVTLCNERLQHPQPAAAQIIRLQD